MLPAKSPLRTTEQKAQGQLFLRESQKNILSTVAIEIAENHTLALGGGIGDGQASPEMALTIVV
jgi:hypothetical protein